MSDKTATGSKNSFILRYIVLTVGIIFFILTCVTFAGVFEVVRVEIQRVFKDMLHADIIFVTPIDQAWIRFIFALLYTCITVACFILFFRLSKE